MQMPSIGSYFRQSTDTDGSADALIFENGSLTYDAFHGRVNALAATLQERGVGPGSLVGVLMDRSPEMMIALWSVLRSGAAYLPLDPADPAERRNFVLDDADPALILTTAALEQQVRGASLVYELDAAAAEHAGEVTDASGPEDPAYVIYTSGSTGRPKGVIVPRGGVLNRLEWMQETFRLTARDRILHKTPFTFDVSVWEIFWPFMFGAGLVLSRPGGQGDPTCLAQLMRRENVSIVHFVPPMLRLFLEEPGARDLPALRAVVCSGDVLPAALRDRFFELYPDKELYNLYGPTEASIDVTAWRCAPEDEDVPIGTEIRNTRIFLMDGALNPLADGESGEICISGAGLARGYLNREELTAEKFVTAEIDGQAVRIYRSGDLGRRRSDGALEFLGRMDQQLKIRGFRVEPGEIEAALNQHPGVGAVAVLGLVAGAGEEDRALVAYVVAPDESVSADQLRAYLEDRLPEYLIPAHFLFLEELPLTANGKLDRSALPAPDGLRPHLTTPYREPRSEAERYLAGVWARLLNMERVGVDDMFFDLGGHSLLATQVMAVVREERGVELSLRLLLDRPTVAKIAPLLAETQPADGRETFEI